MCSTMRQSIESIMLHYVSIIHTYMYLCLCSTCDRPRLEMQRVSNQTILRATSGVAGRSIAIDGLCRRLAANC